MKPNVSFSNRFWICLLAITLYTLSGTDGLQACENRATAVSVQGDAEVRQKGGAEWQPVGPNDSFCPGDTVQTGKLSSVVIRLHNGSTIQLDQNSLLVFPDVADDKPFLIRLLEGAALFFSRDPRHLKVDTPFVTAAIDGTEFAVSVEPDRSVVTVLSGRVNVSNEYGSVVLSGGESAEALKGQAPVRLMVRPKDAVQWALYYPPVSDFQLGEFQKSVQEIIRESMALQHEGNLSGAVAVLEKIPEDRREPRFFAYRAGLFLSAGRLDEAKADIENIRESDASLAMSLLSIIATAQNEKDNALELAEDAVRIDPESATARSALAYARQAVIDLEGALEAQKDAVKLSPENALARARLAELLLAFGDLDEARDLAEKAVKLNPDLSRTQTVLGYAHLTRIETTEAAKRFNNAIRLDQSDPLPRLGLGLAKIRDGDLKEGREEIETAASLDPNNSLIRSYLGKAFYEEKRGKLAAKQFDAAKELDPNDPTPWLYGAIQKQTNNRPVEALRDLQKSVELNDNRAVYRSKFLLDQDLAARSVSLARIYDDLGFQQLALAEGWKSVNADPANHSAHRFLADSYAALPRHEIARVSELLQSQLLQPVNITPVQPHLAESDPYILEGTGPAAASFNEYHPLFLRDRFAFQASGIVGENHIFGDEMVVSGVSGKISYSLGQFHYESDGFRENNDQNYNIYNAFVQSRISHMSNAQFEFRTTHRETGELGLRFDPNDFNPTERSDRKTEYFRAGFRHSFQPCSDIIGSLIYGTVDNDKSYNFSSPINAKIMGELDEYGYIAEIKHMYRTSVFHITGGIGYFDGNNKSSVATTYLPPLPEKTIVMGEGSKIHHSDAYLYTSLYYPKNCTWIFGASTDIYRGGPYELNHDQFNPKFGLIWDIFPTTIFRTGLFRSFTKSNMSNQTIEPTDVAGFNQFFDDQAGTDSWLYGIAIDQKVTENIGGGLELSKRELDLPYLSIETRYVKWKERFGRAYFYWTPDTRFSICSEYQYERFDRDFDFPGIEYFIQLKTQRFPFKINFSHESGLNVVFKTTYILQEGIFTDSSTTTIKKNRNDFCVTDVSIGYKIFGRSGSFTVEARNLFNTKFKFQDTDPANPFIYPDRLVIAKFSFAI